MVDIRSPGSIVIGLNARTYGGGIIPPINTQDSIVIGTNASSLSNSNNIAIGVSSTSSGGASRSQLGHWSSRRSSTPAVVNFTR